MVESIANIVRAWPAERMRDGQPYVALELMCNEGAWRDGVVGQRPLRAAGRGRAGRARSAPPTPTSGSAAGTPTLPGRAPGRCASPGM